MLDPVHGYFEIDKIYTDVIDTTLFQRLGYIRQLTGAQYVFTGARHTRKEHSIGAMYIAEKYINSINKHSKNNLEITNELEKNLKLAALLHDVGHTAYSHAFDDTIYSKIYKTHKGHDKHRHFLIDFFVLPENIDPNKIKDIWNGKIKYLSCIINGPLSVDRMDFTLRDSYYTGVKYGIFDINRIVNNCWIEYINLEPVFVYDWKIVKSAIQGLNSRLYMYEEIYLNRNVIAAGIIIECMILEADKIINLVERVQNINSFTYLNDESLFNEILFSTSEELKEARKYAKLLYERKLPKMITEKKIILKNDEDIDTKTTILENGDIKWKSRILSKNFTEEFEKYNIHISKNDKLYTFKDYVSMVSLDISEESYFFERIYRFEN